MKENELWDNFWSRKVAKTKILGRYLIWVHKKEFNKFRKYFKKEYNFIHPGKSFRSSSYFKHIHAVEEGNYFCIHYDLGNIMKFFPLGILHLFFDVLPSCAFCYIKGIPVKSLTNFPKQK